ncbi:DUF2948 family protein [Celeribacter sp.]|uniref:DUF2948 family protein n=1 Tax=Celeribacter sp. TaxID=1890673 RepID=UPI003A8EB562
MVEDARFEDGGERPLHLKALDAEDLGVFSALIQDAVVPVAEISYDAGKRRFAMLLNRFRWEDVEAAQARGRAVERVQTVLLFDDVIKARSMGVDGRDTDTIVSVLSLAFVAGEDGTGRVDITLAGDGAIALDVETIDATLKDVTRPYAAPSHKVPTHEV